MTDIMVGKNLCYSSFRTMQINTYHMHSSLVHSQVAVWLSGTNVSLLKLRHFTGTLPMLSLFSLFSFLHKMGPYQISILVNIISCYCLVIHSKWIPFHPLLYNISAFSILPLFTKKSMTNHRFYFSIMFK